MFSLFEKILRPELDGFPRAYDPIPWRSGTHFSPDRLGADLGIPPPPGRDTSPVLVALVVDADRAAGRLSQLRGVVADARLG
jgi:hypothetical protein